MGRALMRRLQQTRPLAEPAQEAAVNLLLAGAWLNARLDQALEPVGLTHAQYNVLRILRGAGPAGHPRCDIAARMIDRAPDVTRLIDRLEGRRLVERHRCPEDGRRSVARLTRAGAALLERATAELVPVEEELGRRLRPSEQVELSRVCERLYGPDLDEQ